MHYHLNKKETWYVSTGSFRFRWINTKNADIIEESLKPGDTITNEVGEPHQLICLEEGDIFEVSTHHQDSDSYRVGKGDSQCCL
jgi:mannose-6-phosphate isomerase-like protein (cupin superfamily)